MSIWFLGTNEYEKFRKIHTSPPKNQLRDLLVYITLLINYLNCLRSIILAINVLLVFVATLICWISSCSVPCFSILLNLNTSPCWNCCIHDCIPVPFNNCNRLKSSWRVTRNRSQGLHFRRHWMYWYLLELMRRQVLEKKITDSSILIFE